MAFVGCAVRTNEGNVGISVRTAHPTYTRILTLD